MPSSERSCDTAIFRTASNVGFNARVEPVFYSLERLRPSLGFFEHRRRRKAIQHLVDGATQALARQGVTDRGWLEADAKCVCNLRVARLGLLADLRKYAAKLPGAGGADRFTHLIRHRERSSYYLPVAFPEPFSIQPESGDPVPFGSAASLAEELAEINRTLRVESTFRLRQMVDFLDATQEQVAQYETGFGADRDFWVKFGYVLMQQLVRKSLEHDLPIIFA